MSAAHMKTGLLAGELPFARLGEGAQTLVILPGLADAAWDATCGAWDLPRQYGRFAEAFTVYVISRKRGLPRGYTTRDMAADYARVLEQELGSVAVLGISLGGHIAQYVAADFPPCAHKLVIANSAYRVSNEGRKIPERWLALARQNQWREFYFDIAKVTMREYHQTFYQFLIPLLRMPPGEPSDFLVSLEAAVAHDASASLGRIQAPTLVIGGTNDVFFPPALLRETAERIPQATLRLIDGSGHGAYELRKGEFEDAVLAFLNEGTSSTGFDSDLSASKRAALA